MVRTSRDFGIDTATTAWTLGAKNTVPASSGSRVPSMSVNTCIRCVCFSAATVVVACATGASLDEAAPRPGLRADASVGGSSGKRNASGGRTASGGSANAGGIVAAGSGGAWSSPVDASMPGELDADASRPDANPPDASRDASGPDAYRDVATPDGDVAPMCAPGEKICDGLCTPLAPGVGCGSTDCSPCPGVNPSHGRIVCTDDDRCGIECNDGYRPVGDACGRDAGSGGTGNGGASNGGSSNGGSSGAGGTGGSGGGGPATCKNDIECPYCGFVFGPGCCKPDATCGCHVVPPYVGPCS